MSSDFPTVGGSRGTGGDYQLPSALQKFSDNLNSHK